MAKNLFWTKIAAEYTCWLHSLSLMRKETIKFEDCHYNNYFYWPSLALDESDWEHKTFTSKLSAYYMKVEWNKFPYNWSLTCQSLAAIGNNVTVLWGKLVGFSFYVKYAKAKLKTLYLHFGWC